MSALLTASLLSSLHSSCRSTRLEAMRGTAKQQQQQQLQLHTPRAQQGQQQQQLQQEVLDQPTQWFASILNEPRSVWRVLVTLGQPSPRRGHQAAWRTVLEPLTP